MISVVHIDRHLYGLRDSRFSTALRDAGRAIPGMRWDAAAHAWVGYADAVEACYAELTRNGITVSGVPPAATDGLITDGAPSLLAFASLGRSYQDEGVRFLASRGSSGALLCFDLGLGKSSASLTAARAFKEPTLIVCPSNVRGVWLGMSGSESTTSEVKKWWPDAFDSMRVLEGVRGGAWFVHSLAANEELVRKTHGGTWLQARPTKQYADALAIGTKTKREAAVRAAKQRFEACAWSPCADFAFPTRADAEATVNSMWPHESKRTLEKLIEYVPAALYDPESVPLVTVCHYDILYAWAPHLSGVVRTLILDEAHYTSNVESKRSRAVALVSASAARRYALTGTPMTNRPENLFGVLETISPSRYSRDGKPWDFYRRYCNLRQETVGVDPKTQKTVWKHDGISNANELSQRLQHVMFRRIKTDPDVQLALPKLTRQVVTIEIPKRFCMSAASTLASATRHVDDPLARFNEKAIRKALDLSADGKLPEIVEMVADIVESNSDASNNGNASSKVVVFCWRHVVAEHIALALTERGVQAEFIHGGLERRAREKIISRQPTVLVATIETAGIGINLSYASVGIFAELSWEWHKLYQAEGRLHRFLQKMPVLIRYCIGRGSVDELCWAAVRRKLEAAETIVGKDAGGLRETVDVSAEKEEKAALGRLFESMKRRASLETAASSVG